MSRVIAPHEVLPGTALHPVSWSWALRRAALGILILASAVGLVAWLTYASIEPTVDGAPSARLDSSGRQTMAAEF